MIGPTIRRQSSGPEQSTDGREGIPPGGPLTESAQGDSAGPHDRGVEENTNMSKGTPNPMQSGTGGNISGGFEHAPGYSDNTMGAAGDGGPEAGAGGVGATPTLAPPEPDPDGVRKNCD